MTSATDRLDLAVTELGAGPPLIVLHGLLGRSRNWLTIAQNLQERRTLLLADLRNHGASPWSDAMDYPAMAGDVAALIERRAGGRAAVLGHSMGGKVAITLALTRPELVERLIVADIAPVSYPDSAFDGYIRAMLAIDLDAVTRRAEADAALAPAVPEPAIRGFLLQNLDFTRGERPVWQPNLAILRRALPRITGFPAELAGRTYDGPAFCLRGERSDYVDGEGEVALRRFLPGVEVATVSGAGHWLHADKPAEFLQRLKGSLEP
jgi:pimeloyl-ACP methyl ester carboxylesterase